MSLYIYTYKNHRKAPNWTRRISSSLESLCMCICLTRQYKCNSATTEGRTIDFVNAGLAPPSNMHTKNGSQIMMTHHTHTHLRAL